MSDDVSVRATIQLTGDRGQRRVWHDGSDASAYILVQDGLGKCGIKLVEPNAEEDEVATEEWWIRFTGAVPAAVEAGEAWFEDIGTVDPAWFIVLIIDADQSP